ncbi:hypothetical protein jhhlp_001667 [Lomentospora prolificans]|uniref:DUF7053 domain-containing protein n=1 Tax=Lomentospora prolificans TaxID=41688 RepID=A0A2N3NIU7_9PEZI|nr:hypothetical protein jhhlp_001667 [Lomentospora prolificans]
MLRKKEVFTTITPIPGFIPRQLAIDILHSHSEVITLNPLVLGHKPIAAPRNAAADEFYSTWYEITERIQYVPGMGKMGSGKISFNGCFHDMPWGLQTHIYAPMNIDLRNKYRIAGNQPGVEPPEPLEIGMSELGVPSDGLYLREDIEIRCNIAVVSFVKAQLKAASKEMVQRIIKKAELLDAGVLKAMIYEGKLKTINPNDRSNTTNLGSPGFPPVHTPLRPGMTPPPVAQQMIPVEMPGDYYHPQTSPGFQHRANRDSQMSASSRASIQGPDPRRSHQYTSSYDAGQQQRPQSGFASPSMDHKGFAAELSSHKETDETAPTKAPSGYYYNPQDYQNVRT